jgi:hypothetical protein
MLFDGVHHAIKGSYFGGRLGPWAHMVTAVGARPEAMAPVFILLGAAWIAGGIALVLRLRWAWRLLVAVSAISLAYLVFGTILAVVALAILLVQRERLA